jgi:glucuronoarabinoxylan endo-1,4-beta-xylanase
MKKTILKSLANLPLLQWHILSFLVDAQTPKVRIDNTTPRQKIRFRWFRLQSAVRYDHMTPAEIEKMWGTNSEAGYNIMRLYIPTTKIGAALATAQKAKSLGLIIFASPWSPPAEWKTNGNDAGTYNGVKVF